MKAKTESEYSKKAAADSCAEFEDDVLPEESEDHEDNQSK